MIDRISWFSIVFALPFLLLSVTAVLNPEAVATNQSVKEGMNSVLAVSNQSHNMASTVALLFVIPGLILLGRAFLKPNPLQVILTAIGSCALSMIVLNVFFGKVDSGLLFFAVIVIFWLCFEGSFVYMRLKKKSRVRIPSLESPAPSSQSESDG